MANKVFIATSLDGFIADKNGTVDWLNEIPRSESDDGGFSDFIDSVDAVVMGRKSFETVLGFGGAWPYKKKVFVLSEKLKKIEKPLSEKAAIVSGDLKKIVSDLSREGYKNLYIDGGMTVQGFLRAELIDELVITTVPIILGGGVPLFAELPRIHLEHISTRVIFGGLVQSKYSIISQKSFLP